MLIVIQLAGGNDGLNTVIPVGSDLYYASRPKLAIPPGAALPIDDQFGLHPALTGLKRLYDRGLLAIVQGVGYPNQSLAHFESLDVWRSASLDGSRQSLWTDCCLEQAGAAVKSSQPPGSVVARAGTPLADALQEFGRLATIDGSVLACWVSHAGYDTHIDQAARHGRLLRELGGAVETLVHQFEAARQADRVIVLAFSEFGRSVAENATGGTDHGQAGPVFLMGRGLRPGLHGTPPELPGLHDGEPVPSTDFRRVYAAVLRHWLGTDAHRFLGSGLEPLPLFDASQGLRSLVEDG